MTSWDEVAFAKLAKVLGESTARKLTDKILSSMGRSELSSADDLYEFGERLRREEGFASPLGGLLVVHATINGGNPRALRDAL